MADFDVVEARIADLRTALEAGTTTSVELVCAYLNRIAFYDRHGILLNAVPVLDPRMFEEAFASDERRRAGSSRGPLEGIPFTAKDSYSVEGLTVAAGSPAFRDLIAGSDAFAIAQLRAAGAVLIGLTNMPPMANGGMQRGLYGRAESPYNAEFLTAAFGSGSSNGSGTATAASFAAFGLGEETWSSGRAPASNNALVAYTPSRGLISVRGNWPLVPTMDVVVPHTRSVADLLELLDVLVVDDPDSTGDLWRTQPWIRLPAPSAIRPERFTAIGRAGALVGQRFGVPRMYINGDADAAEPIATRPSVIERWERIRRRIEALGAKVVEVDFPVVSNYERDRPGAQSPVDRGLVPEAFVDREIWDLSMLAWDTFLRANADPALHRLADVDGALIFPAPAGALPDRYGDDDLDLAEYAIRAQGGMLPLEQIPTIEAGLRGLEAARRLDFEAWLDEMGLAGVVFPAVADVGPADADVDPASADLAWRNGTRVANGNRVIRHLGIPTVTVPMGTVTDIGMPVGLTVAGRAYDDVALLGWAVALEVGGATDRTVPGRTPALGSGAGSGAAEGEQRVREVSLTVTVSGVGSVAAGSTRAWINGRAAGATGNGAEQVVTGDAGARPARHSEWLPPYADLVVVRWEDEQGRPHGAYLESE